MLKKLVKSSRAANEAMLSEAETRLGVRLPETLRSLYKILNGGNLDTFHVPLKVDPKPTYDDWTTAFACDYDDVRPLEDLRIIRG